MSQNNERQSVVLPILIPLGILAAIGVALFGFSRLLLSVSHNAATMVALIVAAVVFAASIFVVSRPRVTGGLVLSMVVGVAGVAMVSGGIAAAAFPKGEGAGEEPQDVTLVASVGAAGTGFDEKTLTWAAGAPVALTFDNKDTGVAHNFAISESATTTDSPTFKGATVAGGESTVYQIEAMDAGEFHFFCEIHPTTMNGTLTVTAEGTGAPSGGEGGSMAAAPNAITASGLAFDKDQLELKAGGDTIEFDNADTPGTPHNVSVYEDEAYQTQLFAGDLVTAPGKASYEVNLPAGDYFFRCDVHPTMKGTVKVT